MAKSAAERQRERRQRKSKAGLTEVLLTLDSESMDILKSKAINGKTLSEAICELLKIKHVSKSIELDTENTPKEKANIEKKEANIRKDVIEKLKLEKQIEDAKTKTIELLVELSNHGRTISDFEADEDGVYRVRD